MRLYNIIDYSNIVIATIQAPSDMHAYNMVQQQFREYYNVYAVKVK